MITLGSGVGVKMTSSSEYLIWTTLPVRLSSQIIPLISGGRFGKKVKVFATAMSLREDSIATSLGGLSSRVSITILQLAKSSKQLTK